MSYKNNNSSRTWHARPWKQQLLINVISLLSMFYLLMVIMNSLVVLRSTSEFMFTLNPSEVINNIFLTEYRELWKIGCFLIAIIFGVNLLNQKHRHDMIGTHTNDDRLDNTKKGSTRWLKEQELEKDSQMSFFYPKKPPTQKMTRGGVAINYNFKEDKYFLQSEGNNMIIGPTRSGKTQTLVFPSIMACAAAGENIIITDPKLEIYRTTGSYLEEAGYKFLIINFKNPELSDNWNPLTWVYLQAKNARGYIDWDTGEPVEGHKQWDKFTQARDDLCMTLIIEANEKNKFFSDSARDILKAAITVCVKSHLDRQNQIYSIKRQLATKNFSPTKVAQLQSKLDRYSAELTLSNVSLVLKQYADVPAKGEKSQWDTFINSLADSDDKMDEIAFSVKSTASGDTLSNVMATLNSSISTFVTDEGVKRITATSSFSFEEFNHKKTAVFLAIPDETESRHVFGSLFIAQSYKAFVECCNKNDLVGKDAKMSIPVRYFLDEFANMPIIPKFGNCLTVSLGRQIYFNIFIQSLGQLKTAYERDFATIKDNVNWLIIGVADNETAKEVSEKLGSYTTRSASASVGKNDDSYSLGIDSRQLLTPDELMNQMVPGQLIVTRLRSFPWTTNLPYHWQMAQKWYNSSNKLDALPTNNAKEYKFYFAETLYSGFVNSWRKKIESIRASGSYDTAAKQTILDQEWKNFLNENKQYEDDINISLVDNTTFYNEYFVIPDIKPTQEEMRHVLEGTEDLNQNGEKAEVTTLAPRDFFNDQELQEAMSFQEHSVALTAADFSGVASINLSKPVEIVEETTPTTPKYGKAFNQNQKTQN